MIDTTFLVSRFLIRRTRYCICFSPAYPAQLVASPIPNLTSPHLLLASLVLNHQPRSAFAAPYWYDLDIQTMTSVSV